MDQSLDRHFPGLRKQLCQKRGSNQIFPLPAGESLKSLNKISRIAESLTQLHLPRDTPLIALGGGTLGDSIGFLASIYKRGTPWTFIPTTLLSMIDSAHGGKTAVNLANGKNLLGSFHEPNDILIHLNWLRTLHNRDLVSGHAEMIKVALLTSRSEFLRVQALDLSKLTTADIQTSIDNKMNWVRGDENDHNGQREALNLGHTLAHAIEQATHYKVFRHGEAVLAGLIVELIISKKLGLTSTTYYDEVLPLLLQKIPANSFARYLLSSGILNSAANDKKNRTDKVRIVYAKNYAQPQKLDLTLKELSPLIRFSAKILQNLPDSSKPRTSRLL